MINCNNPCQYQVDGFCNLETASPVRAENAVGDCLYFVPRQPESPADRGAKLPNAAHTGETQA